MSYIFEKISITSTIGINSDNVISGGNWVSNTYTGAGEANDYSYVGVNLQVDESGTLFFDFSQDGTNWSSYPVAGFTIVSGINEVHTAWKGGRYMRPRFVGNGGRTYFRLKTYYSNTALPLSAPLNQSIGSDQDAQIVRAVSIGENPVGSYVNQKTDGIAFQTTASLNAGATFDSGVLDARGYTQVQTHITCNENGTLKFIFGSVDTMTGSTVGQNGVDRVISIPYIASNGFQMFSAPAFTNYVRYEFTNDGASPTTYLLFDTKLLTKSLSGQVLSLNSGIAGGMVANLGRNVIVGQEPDGTYTNQKTDGIAFKTETPLGATGTYISSLISTEGFSQIETNLYADTAGTLTGRWYNDISKTTLIRTFNRPYEGDEIGNVSYFSSPIFGPYLEYEYTNTSGTQSKFFLELELRTKSISGQIIGLKDFIPSTVVANLGRNVIVGETDGGKFLNVPVDDKGHLEMAIHSPLLPFGSVHTESMTPVFQTDAVYGINEGQVVTNTTLSGTSSADDSKFYVGTGTTQFAQGSLQSRRRLRYRPGQGVIGRFTAKFTTPVPFSYQIAGYGHAEDGVYFGYKDLAGSTPEFGILYVNRGVREIQTLTITTASSTAENVTVTLNNVAFSVPVTNSANIQRTVWEISKFDYNGWEAFPSGNTIIFISGSAGNKTGSFSLSGTTVVGTFSETRAGANGTEQFIPQSQWNGEKLDGNGPTGVILDPTKGNVFQINIQYLGFGAIEFRVEVVSGGNNPTWVTVHTMDNPNNLTTTTFANPSFPFTIAAYSAGSTASLTVETGSFAGFIEGDIETRGNRFVYTNSLAAVVSNDAYYALGTIMNKRTYKGKASQVVINIKEFSGHIEDAQSGASLYLIRNGELAGNPNFVDYSSTSSTSWDTAATTVTFTDNNQVVAIMPLGINGSEDTQIEDTITLQPGEWITLAARSDTAILDYCTIAVTTREDQ